VNHIVPRPAATVVVLREGRPFEVLMVRRNDQAAFMAGAYVFPGGRVDEGDTRGLEGLRARGLEGLRARGREGLRAWGPERLRPRFADLDLAGEWAHRRAAVRELSEEANVRLAPEVLEPFAHWVTPPVLEPRRYDTRFFLARMPAGQEARADADETTALDWMTPAQAIARSRGREILLPPPTWTTLRRLERFGSIDEAFAWARACTIVRVQPDIAQHGGETVMTLPGDPLFPAMDRWDIPADTRFVLEEGNRWVPRNP
jgi:8-oxo-dGTP pyrophosphatase MutT (NUDIX family)